MIITVLGRQCLVTDSVLSKLYTETINAETNLHATISRHKQTVISQTHEQYTERLLQPPMWRLSHRRQFYRGSGKNTPVVTAQPGQKIILPRYYFALASNIWNHDYKYSYQFCTLK